MFPKSSLNLIISGILSLLGVILGILIERRFHEREVRRRLFKALFEEVKLNHSIVKRTKETYKGLNGPF
jgi:glucose-6-phosphate-specific signal transduction histidine kinase